MRPRIHSPAGVRVAHEDLDPELRAVLNFAAGVQLPGFRTGRPMHVGFIAHADEPAVLDRNAFGNREGGIGCHDPGVDDDHVRVERGEGIA